MKSKALEINLSDTKIDVEIDPGYQALQEIVSGYFGILKRMDSFLKELSHPLINWEFVVREARHFSLHYFYLYRDHEAGPKALELFIHILTDAFNRASSRSVKNEACTNMMLLMQHALKEESPHRLRFMNVISQALGKLQSLADDEFICFVRCYYQPKPLIRQMIREQNENMPDISSVNTFLQRYYQLTYDYFLNERDPLEWISDDPETTPHDAATRSVLSLVSHDTIGRLRLTLDQAMAAHSISSFDLTRTLMEIPGYADLVIRFKSIPESLERQLPRTAGTRHLKLMFLFYIIHAPGLAMIHEEALREINRTLSGLIGNEDFRHNSKMIDQAFKLLKSHTGTYPSTVLDCIHRVGEAVYNTGDVELINYFIDHVIKIGFQFPSIKGTGEDWQIKGNDAHVKNIRIFFDLIGKNPKLSRRLLSALIISISIGGVLIKDTDLFPREVSRLLNTDILPVFNLVKQLARLLPVFFNEIGAEGHLRDVSTRLDESCQRKDVLVHFLRKQTHVESSSRVVEFIETVLLFWKTGNKEPLKPFVPPSIFDRIQPEGPYVDGLRSLLDAIGRQGLSEPRDFLMISRDAIENYAAGITGVSELDRIRLKLAVELYQLLNQKYNTDHIEFERYLELPGKDHIPDIQQLKNALAETDIQKKLSLLLSFSGALKAVILSPETFEINESIYNKRHFAIDIPSMYGSFYEPKFDALGLMLRIDSLVNVLFEELTVNTDLRLITKATFSQIFSILELFSKALKIDGIKSNQMDLQLEFLRYSIRIRECSFTQYLDIFRGFSNAVRDMINDHFNSIHSANFIEIGSAIKKDQVLTRFLSNENFEDKTQFAHRAAEIFFRDCIVSSLGLQQLDVFLNRILDTLFRQSEELSPAHVNKLLNYDPQNAVARIHESTSMGSNIIYLGNKGLNLIKLKGLGLPVPPGFIITTEVFRCLDIIDHYPPATRTFKRHVLDKLSYIEKMTHKTFGRPDNPLLLSVRSGSSISQPGMMDSFLNVGVNPMIIESLAGITRNPWFAWDSYRRFLQGYGMAFGIARDEFDFLMNFFKQKFSRQFKQDFTGDEMKAMAMAYKTFILDHGIEIEEFPVDQLYLIISKVFESWQSPRAKNYRRIMGISDDWGTAVTVQEMIFGNQSGSTGSGVVFSHSPKLPGDTIRLWGDFTIGNQGEDVVSGLVKTLPISDMQREIEDRDSPISLEHQFPEIYHGLKVIMNTLIYDEGWNPQEIEFTFEGPESADLHLLQARDMSLRERHVIPCFDHTREKLDKDYLSRGIGVSGGALSGRVVFSLEEIRHFRKENPKMPLIILREDTVPDDILEIDSADGILTARGGVTSHAAIVAYSLGKTCVVGCKHLVCNEKEKTCLLNGTRLISGDYISINGQEGSVYKGRLKVTSQP